MNKFVKKDESSVSKNDGFFDKITIKNRVNLLIIFTSVLFFICSNSYFIWSLNNNMFDQKTKQIEYITETAVGIIKDNAQAIKDGKITLKEAQEKAKIAISAMNFDGKNYVWINNYDSLFLAHPTQLGKDGAKLIDRNGTKVIVEATRIAKENGKGVFKYFWNKPGKDKNLTFLKISYVRNFPEWGWVIGAGVYADEIQNELNNIIIKCLQ